jgi:hypothetical protein
MPREIVKNDNINQHITSQGCLPELCHAQFLTAFVVNGLHYSNFLNISLFIEGIIMQPPVVLDLMLTKDPTNKRVGCSTTSLLQNSTLPGV